MQPNEQSKPKKNTARPLGRLGAFLLVTLALLLITLLGVIWVLEKGPSPTITEKFCRSMRETSAIRWIPNIFLSQEEVDAFKSESTENDETETVNTSLIRIAPAAERGTETADDGVELIAITRGTAKGKLLIVRDPSRVILGVSSEEFNAKTPGLQLTGACGQVWRRCRNERGRLQRRKRPRQRRRAAGARDLRRSAAPHRARGRAVQRRRL